jgi:MFS family permease
MLLAPIFGRFVDRWGSIPFVVSGCVVMIATGIVFALSTEPLTPTVAATVEAAFSALLGTALFAMVAAGSPQGRTALAQGIYGSVGTTAVILSTMTSGALYEVGRTLPFWFFAGVVALTFALGMAVYTGVFGRWSRSAEPIPVEAEVEARA